MKYDKIYFWLHGGLGDVAWSYLYSPQWQAFNGIRNTFPNSIIKAIVISYNRQSYELIRYNPHIDEIQIHFPNYEQKDKNMPIYKIAQQYAEGFTSNQDIIGSFGRLSQKIYISERDQRTIDQLADAVPYIIVHPFASLTERMPLEPTTYIDIIDQIIDQLGYNVILIGNNNTRLFGPNGQDNKETIEKLDYKRQGLYNLIGKTNSRIVISLIHQAEGVIGTWSYCTSLSWAAGRKTLTIVPKNMEQGHKNVLKGGKYPHRHPECLEIYTSKNANSNKTTQSGLLTKAAQEIWGE